LGEFPGKGLHFKVIAAGKQTVRRPKYQHERAPNRRKFMEATLNHAAQSDSQTDHDSLMSDLEKLSIEELAMVGGGQGMFSVDL